ncbi:hypothetical protein EG68_05957 [Paragonimus skrjabini miyazakii]|uniref:Protein polybromo-1 n=1 Tax=Paragonimus skrjabini miyazakii TaxID=59628 RepID=A0A8S9YQ02_9TREM|nr:hypothetical protein EG68_05957 [Paragonimus skrjabini miyazakii]
MPKRANRDSSSERLEDPSGEDSQSSSVFASRKRRRLANASQLDLCQEIFDGLRSHRSEDGSFCEIFMRLPSKRSNAEYYETIKEPIDLARIQSKIKADEYETVEQMAADISLLIENTKSFYPASTIEYSLAVELREVFDKERQKILTLAAASNVSTSSSVSSSAAHRRARRGRISKREETDDDEVESASIAASEDSHVAASETSTTNLTTSTQRSAGACESVYEMFFASIVKHKNEDGRSLAPTFTYLPSREIYPVYYAVIKEPVDLRIIARRIQSGGYSSLDELEKDFQLMARNAKTFNEPKSAIYQDASTLAKILKGKRSEAEHPPVRTNKERGKRASRLSYNPHEIVEEYAMLPDEINLKKSDDQQNKSVDSEAEAPVSAAEDEDDTRATGNTSQSCSSVPSSPGKRKRGRPPKNPQSTGTPSPSIPRDSLSVASPPRISSPISESSLSVALDTPQTTETSNCMGTYTHGHSAGVSRYRVGTVRWRVAQVLQAVLDARNEVGHLMCTPFLRLPSRKIYPDYYQEISNPISLADIKKKLKNNVYPTLNSLMADLELVFKNAQQYNLEDSVIHRDSLILQQVARKRYNEMLSFQTTPTKRVHLAELGADSGTSSLMSGTSHASSPHITSDGTPMRRAGRRVLTAEQAKMKRLQNLFNTVYNFVAEDGHRPCDVFLHLPSREEYSDYYKVIPEPIDLTVIRRKMEQNEYSAHQEMVSDLRLMFNNARHYNEVGSNVYNDAVTLERVVKKRLKSLGPYQSSMIKRDVKVVDQFGQTPGVPVSCQGIKTAGDAYQVPMNMVAPPNAGPSGLHPNPQAQPGMPLLQRVILELFQTVREYQVNGRQLSTHFMRLPTRTELPTYYEFIKRPIELQTIAKQVVQMRYPDFEEFVADLFLMFDNACRFNEPNSQIYSDALILHRVCLAKRTAILNTFASHLGIPPSVPPDVVTGIRRLLTNLHNAMLTACDPDGRGLVDSLIAGDGTEAALTSVTATRLAALHRAVAAGCYRRLDRLQHDWLKILKRARVGEGSGSSVNSPNPLPTMQQRLDAAELARRWVRLRDELCHRQQRRSVIFPFTTSPQAAAAADSVGALPSHLSLLSPAMTYTMAALDRELTEEDATYKISVYGDEQGEGTVPELCDGETEVTEVYVRTQPYHVGDYIYVEPLRPNVSHCHIGRIVRITQKASSNHNQQAKNAPDSSELQSDIPSQSASDSATECSAPTSSTYKVFVAWYWRSSEARPSRRRRLLTSEVFRTALIEVIPLGKLMGRCLVLPISQFIRFRPKNVDERDVFICESQFSIKSQTFIKIRNWDIPTPVGIEMEPRPVPFVPTRLPPSEPLENALEQVDTSIYTDVSYPLPRVHESITSDDSAQTDDDIAYEQYVHQNGFLVKLGDFLYIPAAIDSSERHIVRVDKLWKSVKQNVIFISGPWFIAPSAVEHLPTRVFYPKEVFLTSAEHATHALASATGKCYILRPVDYCQARPTDFNEQDVYLCDCKYFEDEKVIRKLKKGLKKFQLSASAYEDEFYFFPQPICPRKEASPLLAQASPEPLAVEQLNRPASTALACVMAASTGNSMSQHVLSTMPAPVIADTNSNRVVDETVIRGTLPSSDVIAESSSVTKEASAPTISIKVVELDENASIAELDADRARKKRKLRKPPSGYVLYAGEVRKRLLQERRDAPFGEISREVGLMWRQMPQSQRDFYERKAKLIKRRMEEEELRVKLREQELARIQLQQQQQLASAATATAMALDERHTVSMLQPHSAVPTLVGQPMSVQPHMVVSAPTAPRHTIGAPSTPTAANVQFYQTPSGQVIQIVHTQPAPNTNSSVGPTPGQPSNVTTAATFSQVPFATLPPLSSGCALPPSGTHQVLYQLSSQPGSMIPASSIGSGTPQSTYFHPQQQRILVASNAGSTSAGTVTAVVGSGTHVPANIVSGSPTAPHTQILLATTGAPTPNVGSVLPTHPLTHSQPNISLVSHASTGPPSSIVQPLVATGTPHEFTGHMQPHFQLVQQAHQPIYPTAVVSASTAHATSFVSSAQAPNLQITSSVQQQQLNRAPSPIFVSTPPRTSRVLHSEIYQRYINRLRKNVQGGLSDWRTQLSVTPETGPTLPANVANQLAGNFLANPQNHAHHASVTEAVWSLRDHLLEDALKIRLRYLNSVECL